MKFDFLRNFIWFALKKNRAGPIRYRPAWADTGRHGPARSCTDQPVPSLQHTIWYRTMRQAIVVRCVIEWILLLLQWLFMVHSGDCCIFAVDSRACTVKLTKILCEIGLKWWRRMRYTLEWHKSKKNTTCNPCYKFIMNAYRIWTCLMDAHNHFDEVGGVICSFLACSAFPIMVGRRIAITTASRREYIFIN